MSEPATIVLSNAPIIPSELRFAAEEGAEIRFLGVVRATESGQLLRGIDYTAFESMAKTTLEQLVNGGRLEHPTHRVFIQHRLGFVPVGEPSLVIHVTTKHSNEAFQVCNWYLRKVKESVPIWKRIVTN
jgi:molybdopterin synthase catalytic subunit